MTTGPLYRAEVVPIPKRPPPKTCNRPLCSPSNQCVSCRNSTSRTKGLRAQKKAAKNMGVKPRFRSQLGNEERWGGPHFRHEHKHGAQVVPIFTKYAEVEAQALQHKAVGDFRGLLFSCSIDGVNDELIIIRRSVWMRDVQPCLEEP